MDIKRKFLLVFLLSGLLLNLSAAVWGQSLFPKKDLIFTQVIASNTFSSIIAVTNRGALPYNGTLFFVKGEGGDTWNPVVNNVLVTGGQVDVLIQAGATKVFVVNDPVFSVGYAIFLSDDWSLDNHIEGNLTYFSVTGATLIDAVGVPESQEFLVTSIPFDSFADVGISLAHPDINQTGMNATIKFRLFDEDGDQEGYCQIQIPPGGHYSRCLMLYKTPVGD